MILTRKIRIYPTSHVQQSLWSISHQCTFLWNFALNDRLNNSSLSIYEQKKKLPPLKKRKPYFKKAKLSSCLNFVKRKETALWQCLSGRLPDRSARIGLHPFSFKLLTSIRLLVMHPTTLGCPSIY